MCSIAIYAVHRCSHVMPRMAVHLDEKFEGEDCVDDEVDGVQQRAHHACVADEGVVLRMYTCTYRYTYIGMYVRQRIYTYIYCPTNMYVYIRWS